MNCKVVSLVLSCALLELAAAQTAAEIVIRPDNTTGIETGSTVLFLCASYGDPVPTSTWRVNGQTLNNDSKFTVYEDLVSRSGIIVAKSVLQICDVEASDAGVYSCSAGNVLGSDSASFEMSVNTAQLLLYPEDTAVNSSSSSVILPCVGYGIPRPAITWSAGDSGILKNSSQVTIYESTVPLNRSGDGSVVQSLLVFCGDSTSTSELQSGQYSCSAVSGNATDTVMFNLTVANGHDQLATDEDTPNERGSTIVSYVGSSVCLLFFLITIITYLSSSSLYSSTTGISLLNLSFAVTLLYVCFIVSHHTASMERLCTVFSSLFHWFFLVSALALTTAAVFRVWQPYPGRKRWLIFIIAITLNWSVPLIVLIVSLSPNYKNYASDEFCMPVEQPYWFGLILPWGIISILTWVALCVAPCFNLSLINDRSWYREHAGLITIALLFDTAWGTGLPPSHQVSNASSRAALEAVFIVSSISLGAVTFLTFCAFSQEARVKWKDWAKRVLCKETKSSRTHSYLFHFRRAAAQESIYSTVSARKVPPPPPGQTALVIHNSIPAEKVPTQEVYEDTVLKESN